MPHRIYIAPERELGIVKWDGPVNGGDLIWAIQELYGNPLWQPGFQACWDGTNLATLDLSFAEMQQVVEVAKVAVERVGDARTASVMSNELHLASMRMLTGLIRLKGLNVKFFRSLDKAAPWLGVEFDWLNTPTGLVASRAPVPETGTD